MDWVDEGHKKSTQPAKGNTVCYGHSASSIWKLFLSFAINPVNNNLPKRIDKEDHDSLAVLRPVLDLF